jgi:ABC-type transport system involved in multi-copper enzyme maturation permease subunit
VLLGPIFSVELTTTGRRTRFVLLRVLYVALLLLSMWTGYSAFIEPAMRRMSTLQQANFARFYFEILAWGQVSAILMVGPALAAGTIAQERERRTLDYLLASDLRSSEIVLSKFAARVVHILYLLLAGLPVLALTRLMGGIDAEGLLMVFLISFSSMLMVAAIAISVSIRSRKAREAVSSVYLILFAWMAWPMLLRVTRMAGLLPMSVFGRWLEPIDWLLRTPNPLEALYTVLHPPPAVAGAPGPWWSVTLLVLLQSLITAACLATAIWSLRRVHRRFAGAIDKPTVWRWPRRTRPVGDRPMLWKELYRERISAKSNLAAQFAAGLIVLGVIVATGWNFWDAWVLGGTPESFVTYVAVMGMITGCAGLLLIGSRAAGSITSEKERDCWVSLLSTTLTGREIVNAKIMGNLYAARGVFLLMAFLWCMAAIIQPRFVLAAVPLAITLGGQALFATSLGVLISLRATSTLRAMGATMALLIFIGGGYMACFAPFLMTGPPPDEGFLLIISAMVPFLLAFPPIVCAEGWPRGREGAVLPFAFILGTIGYWVAGCILWQQAVEQFDRWSGRMRAWRYWDGPPPEAAAVPIATQPVEVPS